MEIRIEVTIENLRNAMQEKYCPDFEFRGLEIEAVRFDFNDFTGDSIPEYFTMICAEPDESEGDE